MREVTYRRYEPHPGWEKPRTAPLSTFIYDVPYLLACGVLPSFPLLNAVLGRGGGDGGMSPGADWEPFELSNSEYQELCKALEEIDPLSLRETARYVWVKAKRAEEFDPIRDREEWHDAVANMYRESFFEEQERNIARDDGRT